MVNNKYFSLFSGIGGFELGIKGATNGQWECAGCSEIDKYATAIYRKQFPEIRNYGDVTKIEVASLPEFDMLCGGFPCQAVSIAGLRKGFDDPRGQLFFEIIRIAKERKPRYIFLENVKGLLSHSKGETYRTILSEITKLGYDIRSMVLNSKNFGVPQNRERVFIIGCLGGFCGREIFCFDWCVENDSDEKQKLSKQISNTIRTNYSKGFSNETYVLEKVIEKIGNIYDSGGQAGQVVNPIGIAPTFSAGKRGGVANMPLVQIGHTRDSKINDEAGRIYDPTGISRTIKDGGGEGAKTGLYVVKVDHGYVKETTDSIATNLDANYYKGLDNHGARTGVLDNRMIRRLTPIECERLQGFPDDYTKFGINDKGKDILISDAQRYKTLGNAVTVNVIEWIAKRLLT